MCQVFQTLLQIIVCFVQMLLRIVMTVLLMLENIVKMILQGVYNLISLVVQVLSLLPICLVFILTSRLKWLLCCGTGCGGACPIIRNTRCECLMTLVVFVILYYILQATGYLDKIFTYLGYTKTKKLLRFGSSTDLDLNETTEQLAKMCRTVHAVLQTIICGIQMLVRVFMTIILMIENLIRMILQTMYNFISFMLQMISLIPICLVFLLTARLKCFMCGGGGACPVARGGACDCLMSLLAIIILFFIFRATGVLDKIFFSLGYTKYRPSATPFVPTPGDITECSRNETEVTEAEYDSTTMESETTETEAVMFYDSDEETTTEPYYWYTYSMRALVTSQTQNIQFDINKNLTTPPPATFPWGRWPPPRPNARRRFQNRQSSKPLKKSTSTTKKWTTVVYYLV